MKWFIGVGPVGMQVASKAMSGDFVGAADVVESSYTGWTPSTNTFNAADLTRGYIPLGGAWLFGKIAGRVLR